ncbi:MAG: replicative DNA helicase [Clostridia bacterium]|nr:replicative DNA helicase [Clostridia bacterium]MBR6006670.1 replicative DNA helicase [Clostridia bacterium]
MEENTNPIPHNSDAEKSVLGSILISHLAAEKALEVLSAGDFYTVAHRDIFAAMEQLYNAGKLIDNVTLVDMLEKMGKLESAGGAGYIAELAIYTPSARNVEHYIKIVEANAVRRQLITVGSGIAQDAAESTKETEGILDDAERKIYNIAMRKTSDNMERIGPIYTRVYNQIGELLRLGGKRTGIPTGLADLDELTSGLQRSDLVIVAGRPSSGKSAFAFGLAAHAAIREKANVAIFDLEMSKEQVVMRIMSGEAGINMQKIRTGELGATEILKIADQFNSVAEANIMIDDNPNVSVADIRSKCRRLKAMHGLDIVVIDYLQLLQPARGRKDSSRVQEVTDMTRGLKILARELNVTVILLSQLSREPDKRKDHTPLMSDLRESGSIEQDADVIMMLYRPASYPETQEAADGDNTSYINVAKHRNGATANIRVMWVPEVAKYTNYASDV